MYANNYRTPKLFREWYNMLFGNVEGACAEYFRAP